MVDQELESVRKEIQDITRRIIRLYADRQTKSRLVGEIKKVKGLVVKDSDVERALKNVVLEECNKVSLDAGQGLRLLNILVDSSIHVQGANTGDEKENTPTIFDEAKKIERQGSDIIHLEIGEPDFEAPAAVVSEVQKSLRLGQARYTESGGIPELRNAIAGSYNDRSGLGVNSKEVIVTPGSRFGTFLALQATIKPGSEVIIPEPAWPGYQNITEFIGGHPIMLHTNLDDQWSPTIDAIQENISDATDMIVLNYPNNPTGKIIEEDVLRGIVDLASDRDITVLWDEAYVHYAFRPYKSILQIPECRFIVLSTFSKGYSMTGYRLGYALSDEETISKMIRTQNMTITSVPEFIQYGALKAFETDDDVKQNAAQIKKRIEVAEKALRGLPISYISPDGGLYVFMKVLNKDFDSYDFGIKLLKEKLVAVAPGTMFGPYNDHLRISCCVNEEKLVSGIAHIGELLS